MNIRRALLIGVDNYLVDELHQLVVAGGRGNIVATRLSAVPIFVQAAQKIINIAGVFKRTVAAEHLIQRL